MKLSAIAAEAASKQNEKKDIASAPDTYTALVRHGGNLCAARELFSEVPEPWIDLSTGINPFAYPMPSIHEDVWSRLPEPNRVRNLERIATEFYKSRNSHAVAASGSQALIQFLPHILPTYNNIRILGFTYSGHAKAWKAVQKTVATVNSFSDLYQSDVAIVVNPNNPDGRLIRPEQLLDLAQHLDRNGGVVIVDEAFMDFIDPSYSVLPSLPRTGMIVLRSFGKTFGLAGVRLGFAFCPYRIEEKLRSSVGFWAISGAAVEVGEKAFLDKQWFANMKIRLQAATSRLDDLLARNGGTVTGGTTLFRLVKCDDAQKLFMHLASHGILVRPFEMLPGHLRIGIPGSDLHWERLEKAFLSYE